MGWGCDEWLTRFQSKITRPTEKVDSRESSSLVFEGTRALCVCVLLTFVPGAPRSSHPAFQHPFPPPFQSHLPLAISHFPMPTALGGTFNTTWVTFYGQQGSHVCVHVCMCGPGLLCFCVHLDLALPFVRRLLVFPLVVLVCIF